MSNWTNVLAVVQLEDESWWPINGKASCCGITATRAIVLVDTAETLNLVIPLVMDRSNNSYEDIIKKISVLDGDTLKRKSECG